ncbi:hypothetical protein P7C70_g3217, partial [Phenoliferia sp. Uapishka_3]
MAGELTAAIGAALVDDILREDAKEQLPAQKTTVLTDYLNVVRVTEGRDFATKPAPLVAVGGSYNKWLLDLVKTCSHLRYVHVKAHTGQLDQASEMNEAADELAKRAHAVADITIEYPIFSLPKWALWDGKRGIWVEGSYTTAVEGVVTTQVLDKMSKATQGTMNRMQGIRFAPPTYLYKIAISTSAAQIQALIRTHSLPTGARDGTRLAGHLTTCSDCNAFWETEHHIFEVCEAGATLKRAAVEELRISTTKSLEIGAPDASEHIRAEVLEWATGLPYMTGYWWLFPLQVLPPAFERLPTRCQKRLHDDWHRGMIQLTGRVYGRRARSRAGWAKA